jgi:hypothetical protein
MGFWVLISWFHLRQVNRKRKLTTLAVSVKQIQGLSFDASASMRDRLLEGRHDDKTIRLLSDVSAKRPYPKIDHPIQAVPGIRDVLNWNFE